MMRHVLLHPKYRLAGLAVLGCLFCQWPLGAQTHRIRIRQRPHDYQPPPHTSAPDVTYQGGALVDHASFWTVYWSSYFTSGLGLSQRKYFNSFVQTMAPSPGFTGMFTEYQEPQYPILAGNWAGEKLITDGAPTTFVDDTGIIAQINQWIASSVLPVPDSNTVYVIFTGAGVDVTAGGYSACDPNNGFVGYHNVAFSPEGTFGRYRYIVMPYQNCGADIGADGPVSIDGMTDTLGHEMSETETDPDVGFSTFAYGWEDANTGNEIADICVDTSATLGYLNFWLQKVWSQAAQTCIGPLSGSSSVHLTISTMNPVYTGETEPSGAANILPGIPATFTITTDSTTPVSLSVSGLPTGVTYNLSQPTVTAASGATLEVSTGASPGSSITATVTASLNSQTSQFQFLVNPWIQVSNVNVTHTAFTYNSSLGWNTGTVTVTNTGSQPIGPTILLAYHGLDSSIFPINLNAVGTAGFYDEVAPTGDYAVQFPDGILAPGQSVTANVAFNDINSLAISFTPQVFYVQTNKMCDISQTANTNVADVQLMIDEALGVAMPADDLNNDGLANITDVQIVLNSALGLGCSSGHM